MRVFIGIEMMRVVFPYFYDTAEQNYLDDFLLSCSRKLGRDADGLDLHFRIIANPGGALKLNRGIGDGVLLA